MDRYYNQYCGESTIFRISHFVNSKDWTDFAMLFTSRKAGELQILCCQGIKVNDYNFTLDVLALKPSGFCNVRVNFSELNFGVLVGGNR